MNATTEQLIRNLATESKDRRMFFQNLLVWLANETKSCGGIVWEFTSDQRQSIAQFQAPDHPPVVLGLTPENHQQIQKQAIAANQGIIVRPKANLPDAVEKKHPVILMSGTKVISDQPSDQYLIEIFLPSNLDEDAYRNASKRLDEACREVAEIDLPKRPVEAPAVNQALELSSLDSFTREIHRSIDPAETANRIANETRRVLDCDRVSVIQVRGGRPKIIAISGQASVNQRSNIVYAMRKLARKVIPTQQPLWYPCEDALPPQIEKPLTEYLGVASTRSMLLQPFFDRPEDESLPPGQKPLPRNIIGAIVIERCDQQWDRTSVENQLAMVTGHAEDAFRNAYQHRNLLFYPLWHWLGNSWIAMFTRNLTKTALATTAALALIAVLLFVPADFKIASDGVLVPKNRSNVFATVDGTVVELKVKHGSTVAAGDELLRLKNIDLESQAAQLDGKINQLIDTIDSTETLLLAGDTDVDQPLAAATINSQRAELDSYQTQRDLIKSKLEKLSVVAPRDGQVVTWNLEQRFRLRPVSRGEKLMEIVDKQGPWQLELMVPDRKAGHLLAANKDSQDPLAVEFILAADTSSTRIGSVAEIGNTTLIDPELGQCVRVLVDTKLSVADIQQIRSGVSAKIVCGKSSLGYSLFHGVGEFVQKHWFTLF